MKKEKYISISMLALIITSLLLITSCTGSKMGAIDDLDEDGIANNSDTDIDGDGVSNTDEATMGTDPYATDTDGDGIKDGVEKTYSTCLDGTKSDTDGDGVKDPDDDYNLNGLSNKDDIDAGIDPCTNADDTDNDGILDKTEREGTCMKVGTKDTDLDPDGDSLTNTIEANSHGTNACLADTDGDGMNDDYEVTYEACLRPLVADATTDADSDSLSNLDESTYGTSPCDSDTDDDGMPDNYEITYTSCVDPLVADGTSDTDGDGLTNVQEYNAGENTSPCLDDTDSDGMEDPFEITYTACLNPLADDAAGNPDGDELTNLEEHDCSTQQDPCNDTDYSVTLTIADKACSENAACAIAATPSSHVCAAVTGVTLTSHTAQQLTNLGITYTNNTTTGSFSWTPKNLQSGIYKFTFQATNAEGLTASDDVYVTVSNDGVLANSRLSKTGWDDRWHGYVPLPNNRIGILYKDNDGVDQVAFDTVAITDTSVSGAIVTSSARNKANPIAVYDSTNDKVGVAFMDNNAGGTVDIFFLQFDPDAPGTGGGTAVIQTNVAWASVNQIKMSLSWVPTGGATDRFALTYMVGEAADNQLCTAVFQASAIATYVDKNGGGGSPAAGTCPVGTLELNNGSEANTNQYLSSTYYNSNLYITWEDTANGVYLAKVAPAGPTLTAAQQAESGNAATDDGPAITNVGNGIMLAFLDGDNSTIRINLYTSEDISTRDATTTIAMDNSAGQSSKAIGLCSNESTYAMVTYFDNANDSDAWGHIINRGTLATVKDDFMINATQALDGVSCYYNSNTGNFFFNLDASGTFYFDGYVYTP